MRLPTPGHIGSLRWGWPRRSAITQAPLNEKAEASGHSSARCINPIERAALSKRLCKPGMTDDEVDEIVGIVDAYLADVCARLTGAPGFVAGQRTPRLCGHLSHP